MGHCFDIYTAEKFGVYSAILVNELEKFSRNKRENTLRDGKWWIPFTRELQYALFPYMPESELRSAIETLVSRDILLQDGEFVCFKEGGD